MSRRAILRATPAVFSPLLLQTPQRNAGLVPAPLADPAVVFLDPGHGGVDTGTIGTTEDGTAIDEKTVTLALAQRAAAKLEVKGFPVVLSRTDDSLPGSTADDYTGDGIALTPQGVLADLQRRIDRANASGARVMLSIHLNGFDDPSVRGAETFYDSARVFGTQNARFAGLIQSTLIAALQGQGYDTPDRGITDDSLLSGSEFDSLPDYNHLIVLGPGVLGALRPSTMPGALCESLYLSNPVEASAAVDPAVQDLIATAFTQAIARFLGS
jgi:N-acetylmuramoyl-L-alanine amidase